MFWDDGEGWGEEGGRWEVQKAGEIRTQADSHFVQQKQYYKTITLQLKKNINP